MGCVFCQIVDGQAPASVVYSDGTVMAIMDIAPIVPGHLLVIPKRHVELMTDLAPGEGAACWVIAETMAKALRGSGLRVEGVNLFVADGEASLSFPPDYGEPVDRTALDDAAARIRGGLGG